MPLVLAKTEHTRARQQICRQIQWDVTSICRPALKANAERRYLADQCAQAFSRANVGFSPYILRYAYGHRGTVTFSYEAPIIARQMGHSLAVHRRTYQRFLNAALVKKKVAEMKARPGLPQAPKG